MSEAAFNVEGLPSDPEAIRELREPVRRQERARRAKANQNSAQGPAARASNGADLSQPQAR